MKVNKINRLEVIDHTPNLSGDDRGRVYVKYNVESCELVYQDNGKTLKIFINNNTYENE